MFWKKMKHLLLGPPAYVSDSSVSEAAWDLEVKEAILVDLPSQEAVQLWDRRSWEMCRFAPSRWKIWTSDLTIRKAGCYSCSRGRRTRTTTTSSNSCAEMGWMCRS